MVVTPIVDLDAATVPFTAALYSMSAAHFRTSLPLSRQRKHAPAKHTSTNTPAAVAAPRARVMTSDIHCRYDPVGRSEHNDRSDRRFDALHIFMCRRISGEPQ